MQSSGAANAPRSAWGLATYVVAAILARSADGGVVVAVVLLVTLSGGSGALAGAMAACVTAPHLFGPFVARRIDTSDDPRHFIAAACGLFALVFTTAILGFGHLPHAVVGGLLMVAGACGPLLTGGLSSRLPYLTLPDRTSQRRTHGWDVATYGLGGTIGPSVVAGLAGTFGAVWGAAAIAVAAAASTVFTLMLPKAPPSHGGDPHQVPSALRVFTLMATDSRLRRTAYMTMLVAFGVAALPVVAVYLAPVLGVSAASAALLTAVYGIGNLAGSAGVMARPIRLTPDQAMAWYAGFLALALVLVATSGNFHFALAAYFVTGCINAYFFAATLAARTEYAPEQGKGQVYLWVGALKIAAGSAGTAVAGMVVTGSTMLALWIAVAAVVIAPVVSRIDQQAR